MAAGSGEVDAEIVVLGSPFPLLSVSDLLFVASNEFEKVWRGVDEGCGGSTLGSRRGVDEMREWRFDWEIAQIRC